MAQCSNCRSNNTYYSILHSSWWCERCKCTFDYCYEEVHGALIVESVPMPYGKLFPSLLDSCSYDYDGMPEEWRTFCPSCGSDNVCVISPKFNPELEGDTRWFCITCKDSWKYKKDD